jgi:UDP-N-acetylmuramyl pentapeptide phosphotransferase/UDP-N-acetylglucosamine-1-phosphate transferase
MSVALGVVVGILAARVFVVAGRDLLAVPALQRVNYRGVAIPTAAGIFAVLAVTLVEAGRSTLGAFGVGDVPTENRARPLVLLVTVGYCLVGLIDDLAGTEHDRGFRGHLGALVRGRMTTGVVKIVGGAAVALVAVAAGSEGHDGGRVVADAALIALAANLANLLDRAPGRAIKVGLAAWVPLAIVAGGGAVGVAIAPVVGAFVALAGDDLRERLMIGDAGAYAFGAALGLAVVLECAPETRSVVLGALVALNAVAELVSFSRVIDRVAPLRALDRLGRRPA